MNIENIMRNLSEPFTEDELEFRVGATNGDKTMGLALAYVQARAIQIRLDEVLGIDKWSVEYRELKDGFICRLGIKVGDEWIYKEDGASITDFESIKGGISSAFKRVASSGFGIGRYLYSARSSWFPIKLKGNRGYEFVSPPKLDVSVQNKQSTNKTIEQIKNDNEGTKQEIFIEFGKYKGMSLNEIYIKDKNYIQYLEQNTKDKNIKEKCKKLSAS